MSHTYCPPAGSWGICYCQKINGQGMVTLTATPRPHHPRPERTHCIYNKESKWAVSQRIPCCQLPKRWAGLSYTMCSQRSTSALGIKVRPACDHRLSPREKPLWVRGCGGPKGMWFGHQRRRENEDPHRTTSPLLLFWVLSMIRHKSHHKETSVLFSIQDPHFT